MNSLGTSGRPARDQVVQEGLNRCGILGRRFHQRQRMLVAFAVNPDRGDQQKIVAEMQPVDLDHQKSSADRSAAMKSASSATNLREAADFETPHPGGAGTSYSGSRTARPNRRVDTLISIRFIGQRPSEFSWPVVSQVPDRDLAAVHAPDPRALDLDLAAVEADPSPRSAPTVRPPRRIATVARLAGRRDIRLHHRAERLASVVFICIRAFRRAWIREFEGLRRRAVSMRCSFRAKTPERDCLDRFRLELIDAASRPACDGGR